MSAPRPRDNSERANDPELVAEHLRMQMKADMDEVFEQVGELLFGKKPVVAQLLKFVYLDDPSNIVRRSRHVFAYPSLDPEGLRNLRTQVIAGDSIDIDTEAQLTEWTEWSVQIYDRVPPVIHNGVQAMPELYASYTLTEGRLPLRMVSELGPKFALVDGEPALLELSRQQKESADISGRLKFIDVATPQELGAANLVIADALSALRKLEQPV